jgi:hypothetical protein
MIKVFNNSNAYRKIIFALLFLVKFSAVQSQNIDSCGTNNDPLLTENEARFLNTYFKEGKGDFDFTNKKMGILTGTTGGVILSKQSYFKIIREGLKNSEHIVARIIILNEEQKSASNGYDVLLTYYVKMAISKSRLERIIKTLP